MKVGDIRTIEVYDAKTKKTETIEHIVTKAYVNNHNAIAKEQEIQLIIEKLEELDKIISRKDEERRKFDLLLVEKGVIALEELPYWNYDDIAAQKEELRAKL